MPAFDSGIAGSPSRTNAATRTWLEVLESREAEGRFPWTFRGESFFVEGELDTRFGRRTQVDEFIDQDAPSVNDLGRMPRRFKLTCVVVGSDYLTYRDRLFDAFEGAGPGPLVHPTLGPVRVQVEGEVRLRESTREGGRAAFEVQFVQVNDASLQISPETASAVHTAVVALQAQLEADFGRRFNLTALAGPWAARGLAALSAVTRNLYGIESKVGQAFGALDQVEAQVADLKDVSSALARSPGDFAGNVIGFHILMCSVAKTLAANYQESTRRVAQLRKFAATARMFAEASAAVVAVTPFPTALAALLHDTASRRQDAANRAATEDLTRRAGLASACDLASVIEFASADDANELLAFLVSRFDAEELTAEPEVYEALVDLRSAIAAHLLALTLTLPGRSHYTPARTLPSLVVAYQLTGDASAEADVVELNFIRHPMFVPGGEELSL
jgi:prophage DNA circulation protein